MDTSIANSPVNIIKSGIKLKNIQQKAMLSLVTPDSYFSQRIINLAYKAEELKWGKRLQEAGIPNATKIFTYTSPNELQQLYKLAAQCPPQSVALEIGSHLGASSCYIAAGLKLSNGHLLCVDTWDNETMPEGEQNTYLEFQQNTAGVKQQIQTIRKRSENLGEDDVKSRLNLAFIDGDHSYQAVKRDFELVQQWIAEDGIIAFHDFSNINYEGVSQVVGEALASGKWMLMGKVETLAWIKRANWEAPTWI